MKLIQEIAVIIMVSSVSISIAQQDTADRSNSSQMSSPYVKVSNGSIFKGRIVRYDKEYAIVNVDGSEIPISIDMIVEVNGSKPNFPQSLETNNQSNSQTTKGTISTKVECASIIPPGKYEIATGNLENSSGSSGLQLMDFGGTINLPVNVTVKKSRPPKEDVPGPATFIYDGNRYCFENLSSVYCGPCR